METGWDNDLLAALTAALGGIGLFRIILVHVQSETTTDVFAALLAIDAGACHNQNITAQSKERNLSPSMPSFVLHASDKRDIYLLLHCLYNFRHFHDNNAAAAIATIHCRTVGLLISHGMTESGQI